MNDQQNEPTSAPTLAYEGHLPPPPLKPVRPGCIRAVMGAILLVVAAMLMTIAVGSVVAMVRHFNGAHRLPDSFVMGLVIVMGAGSLICALTLGIAGLRLVDGRPIRTRKTQE